MDLMSLIHEAGFQGSAANTMYGIVMAESGGNAHAHNGNAGTGDNSYGLAQINMLGSMGPARLQEFGLSSNEQLFDPLTNLKVAYKLSGGGANFTPWTTFTSGAYRNAAPGATVSNSGTGHATTVTSAPTNPTETPAQKKAALLAGVGPLASLLTSIPELSGLLNQAVSKGLTGPEFQQLINNSKWYRTHSDSVRNAMVQQASDPKTYQKMLGQEQAKVQSLANQMGVQLGGAQLAEMAHESYLSGYTTEQLTKQLAGEFNRKGKLGGQAAQIYDDLQKTAASYGQNWSDSSTRFRTQQVLGNSAMLETYKEQMKTNAMAMYPGLISQIKAGLTVDDVAQPYKQTMAQLLEVDPASVTLNDRMIKQALQGTGAVAKGQQPTVVPLTQFEEQVRSDPRWQMTNNARNDTAALLETLGHDWGYSAA